MTTTDVFLQMLYRNFTSCFVIAAVLLVRLTLKKAPKLFSYLLWSVVLFRLLCPVSVTLPFSVIPKEVPRQEQLTEWTKKHAEKTRMYFDNTEQYKRAVEQGRTPLPAGKGGKYVVTGEDGISEPKTMGDIWLPGLSMLWLAGIAGILGYSVWTLLRLKQKLVGSVCVRDNIYLSDYIATPFTLGIIKPKIYLPSSLTEKEQNYIIKHEQTHIKRGDTIVKMAAFLTLALYWFNPLVWLAFRLAGKDMEMSCDEAVMKRMEEDIRAEYSSSLLKLATGKEFISGTILAFGEGDTAGRVRNVMHYKKPAFWIGLVSAALVLTAVFALLGNREQIEPEFKTVPGKIDIKDEMIPDWAKDEYYFADEYEIGLPCDPIEEGWDLENIIDAQEEYEHFNWPKYGNYDNTYLLEQTESYTLYGKGDYELMLLEHEGSYAQIRCPFTGMLAPIDLVEADFDADGEKEAVMILSGILRGTGYCVDNLFVADHAEDGTLTVYQLLEDNYLAQLENHFSYEVTEQGVQPMLDARPAGPFVENQADRAFDGAYLGDIVHFNMQNGKIKLRADIASWPKEGAVSDYNGQNITATVEYRDGGEFVLNEFKSYNEYLDMLITNAVKSFWAYENRNIEIVELRYDASLMNEEKIQAVAVVLAEDDDSYDYAEVTFIRQDTGGIVNWKVEDIALEK